MSVGRKFSVCLPKQSYGNVTQYGLVLVGRLTVGVICVYEIYILNAASQLL